MAQYNVSIDCGLSAAHVVGCGILRIPEAVLYCLKHAWSMASYHFDYSPKFWACVRKLKIERVKLEEK